MRAARVVADGPKYCRGRFTLPKSAHIPPSSEDRAVKYASVELDRSLQKHVDHRVPVKARVGYKCDWSISDGQHFHSCTVSPQSKHSFSTRFKELFKNGAKRRSLVADSILSPGRP